MSTEVEEQNKDIIKATDVKIFPHRILKPTTTETILNQVMVLDGVLRVLINGESLPTMVNFGPAKGYDVPLRVSVGEIILTVQLDNLEDFVEQVDQILNETLSFGYDIKIGVFTKNQTSVSDYMKYGEGFEGKIDSRLIGLVDPNAKSSETVRYIR